MARGLSIQVMAVMCCAETLAGAVDILSDGKVKEKAGGRWEDCALPGEKTEKETRKQKEGCWDRVRRKS